MSDGYADVRPIIVAEHASARFGGEAIIPLQYFQRLRARGVEAWLVVHERTRAELDGVLGADRDRVVYVPDRPVQKALWQMSRVLPHRVFIFTFGLLLHASTQRAQRREVRALVPRVRATVVHEPIPVSPRAPSMTYGVGAPVIIGPMNGGMTFPPGFASAGGWLERWLIPLGRRFGPLVNALVPGKRQAAMLLVANERTRAALPGGSCRRVVELVENGVDLSLFRPRGSPRSPRARTRFAFVGRLIAVKAVDLLLDAVARASAEVDLELHVIGDGPERPALEARARKSRLGDRVVFHGFVPQDRCPTLLADADALVMPSLQDCGGAVVLEAMAMGLPVIATRWGGPADYLDDSTGVLVDPAGPVPFVDGLSVALVRLARAPELRARLGLAALERARREFDWERKVDRIIELYRAAPIPPPFERTAPAAS
jgi:glycosyltransferase involved in cell wall biosynthesis